MVFYIEACESGSMMNHLPTDIDGELNFISRITFQYKNDEPASSDESVTDAGLCFWWDQTRIMWFLFFMF